MKLRLLKAKHWLLITLMGLLGLSSCEKQKDMYGCPEPDYNDSTGMYPMYGVPETDFRAIN